MRGYVLLVLGGVAVEQVSASSTTDTARMTHSMFDINFRHIYRQVDAPNVDIPIPASSSFSWVNPPGGVPTTHTTPPPQTANPPTLVFSFVTSSSSNLAVPIASSAPTTDLTVTPTLAPTPSQISISALPPLSSSALPHVVSHPKKQPESDQKFKLIYLAPIFALLGVLWGSLTAWFAYGCFTRRPKVIHEDSAVGGPRYVPAESDDMDSQRDVEEGRLNRENEEAEEVFCWPGGNDEKPEVIGQEAEDDPFLVPGLAPPGRTSKSTRSTRTAVSAYSDNTSVALLELYESDSEDKRKEDEVPWESLRHKSIKRGILEQVKKEGSWVDSLRGIADSSFSSAGREDQIVSGGIGSARRGEVVGRRMRHTRTDSDLFVQDVDLKVPDRVTLKSNRSDSSSGYSTQPTLTDPARTPVRANSSQTTHTVDSRDSTQWVNGGGFRIVEESPAPTPMEPGVSRSKFGSGWWWGSGADVDRYTPVPPRPDRSHSRSTSPVKGAQGGKVQHPHAGMLPQSPPQITSPLLENRLCFTPTPASRARMTSGAAKRRMDDSRTTPTKSSTQKEKGRRLRSPTGPPLPFPVDPDRGINSPHPDIYRARLVKPPSKDKARPPISTQSSSGSSESSRDAERVASVALKKVGDIIGQSWSTRDLGEEGVRSLSPTGFGRRI